MVDPANGMAALANFGFPMDLTAYPYDVPFPDPPPTDGQQGCHDVIMEMTRRENMTVGDVAWRAAVTRGHLFVLGDPARVADHLIAWFDGGGADGFNLMCAEFPTNLDFFVDYVVPELQRRGYFREQYHGHMLRDHLAG